MKLGHVAVASLAATFAAGALLADAKDGAAMEVVPLILVHGHGADPSSWATFLDRYGVGRARIPELYAQEADGLAPGSLPRALVVSAGYYRESAAEPKYGNHDGSIGACPTPRDDGRAGHYRVSFAKRLERMIEGVCRATGSDKVDLALHSMGNLVGRATTRWLAASGGKCRVRKLLCVVGPHRGINALEATVDGLEHHGDRDFMDMGELAEMCSEYKAWGGRAYVDHLNDGWDAFCGANGVDYAGISASGPLGKQVDPGDPTDSRMPRIFGHEISGAFGHIVNAIEGVRLSNVGEVAPLCEIWMGWDWHHVWGPISYPVPHLLGEYHEATGPGDGTVRLASSRMDEEPFHRAATWALFEGRHGGDNWNVEQSSNGATFTSELARELCFTGKIAKGGHVDRCQLEKVDAPGKASFLALETTVSGAPLVSAQVVEQTVGADGKVDANAATASYGCPLPLGTQRAFIPIAPGGGKRRYRVVLYGPAGAVTIQDGIEMTLAAGDEESPPTTSLDAGPPASIGIAPALGHLGAGAVSASTASASSRVHVTATSNTSISDPTLRFSFRLDDGEWSAFTTSATYDSPPLAPGEHRLEARARHANNAAHVACDDAQGTAIGILVAPDGRVSIRH